MIPYIRSFFDNHIILSSKNSSLDGLRGLAVILVFNVHLFGGYYKNDYNLNSDILVPILKTLHAGHIGVDFFFILSGYFMYYTIKNNTYTVFSFYLKRYLRLFPLVIFILIVFLNSATSLQILFDQITLLNVFGKTGQLNYVQWSLTYEVYFYIIIGFLLIKFPKYFDRYFSLFLIIFILLSSSIFIDYSIEMPRFVEFFIGALISKAKLENKFDSFRIFQKTYTPIIALFFIFFFSFLWGNDLIPFNNKSIRSISFYLPISIFLSILLISVIQSNIFINKVFSYYPIRLLGAISFSFYMIHGILVIPYASGLSQYLFKNIFHYEFTSFLFIATHYLLSFILTFIFSLFLFYFLEKPYFAKKTSSIK